MIIHNDFYFSIHILLCCSLLITIKNDMFDQSEGKLWNYCLVILTNGNQGVECTQLLVQCSGRVVSIFNTIFVTNDLT